MSDKQSYANHARIAPWFHYLVLPIFLLNLISAAVIVARFPSVGTLVGLLVAFALIVLAFSARGFAITVQNRVIRLEMRLRLRELLPADLQPAIAGLTLDQLVALRFAGDAELPELVRAVLRGHLADRKIIKQMVRDWQADDVRA